MIICHSETRPYSLIYRVLSFWINDIICHICKQFEYQHQIIWILRNFTLCLLAFNLIFLVYLMWRSTGSLESYSWTSGKRKKKRLLKRSTGQTEKKKAEQIEIQNCHQRYLQSWCAFMQLWLYNELHRYMQSIGGNHKWQILQANVYWWNAKNAAI